MRDLSILIPSRQEEWLARTVADVLEHRTADTEVIVILDGAWPSPPLPQHEALQVVHAPKSMGQRAATNQAARLSTARYVMKLDAHCAVAPGFDAELIRAAGELGPDVTQIPAQKNLHIYDWVCGACGHRKYQGPPQTACEKCQSPDVQREVVWHPRSGTTTTSWRFDADLHFQYWHDFKSRPEGKPDICDVMTSLGACFFMERERFWQLGGLDEACGSWGQYGVEIACKSWLSGGRQVVNKRTWFAHFFRVGGIGFPYEIHGSEQERARQYSRAYWRGNKWPGQVRPLSWLVEHFWPVPGWTDEQLAQLKEAPAPGCARAETEGARGAAARESGEDIRPVSSATPTAASVGPPRLHSASARASKGVVYYSDCRGDGTILEAVRAQLRRAVNGHRIVSATLAPVDLGTNVVLELERGYLTMFRQILAGLEAQDADVLFLAEHDVLYHPSHFDFVPPRDDTYYYNVNTWKVDAATGRALHYVTRQTSGLCASRKLLLAHYRARVERVEREGFTRAMGFEPGTHRRPRGIDDHPSDEWRSPVPNVDIRHGFNLTPSRWRQDQFRNPGACLGWTEAAEVPGWGPTLGRFPEFLMSLRG